MKKKTLYKPSVTHVALHPPSNLITCACGVKFAPRPENEEDDDSLCLTCNRKSWSKLWGKENSKNIDIQSDKILPISDALSRLRQSRDSKLGVGQGKE